MTQPTQRPNWLPPGHSHCPGAKERVIKRMFMDGTTSHDPYHQAEPMFQMVYSCEHGEWLSQAEAWADHEAHMPELTPNSDQSATAIGGVSYGPPPQIDSGS